MDRSEHRNEATADRRTVLVSGATLGAVGAVGLLAACTAPESSDTADESGNGSATTAGAATDATTSAGSAGVLAATSEVPVGGGKIITAQKVVVTQPTSGDFKAFSATCTHAGCLVSKVADNKITCTCHNSVFSAADGSVESGPATGPLPAQAITVENDQIKLS